MYDIHSQNKKQGNYMNTNEGRKLSAETTE